MYNTDRTFVARLDITETFTLLNDIVHTEQAVNWFTGVSAALNTEFGAETIAENDAIVLDAVRSVLDFVFLARTTRMTEYHASLSSVIQFVSNLVQENSEATFGGFF